MENHFLDVVFQTAEFDLNMRHNAEDALADVLDEAKLGEVTGAGWGDTFCILELEVTDLDSGVALIRKVLIELDVPQNTVIKFYPEGDEPVVEYPVQEQPTN